MDLAGLVASRPTPGAGVLVCVTNRCPLHCAHCSSSSTMAGDEQEAGELIRFVESFGAGPAAAPRVMMLTGGEPLLRPALVAELARTARGAGTATAVLTGAFFANHGRSQPRSRSHSPIPDRIRGALAEVDHVSVSIDRFHEREVPRSSVFSLLRELLDAGAAVSVHAVGSDRPGGYLDELAAQLHDAFGHRVPMLANTVRPVGRAASWAGAGTVAAGARARVLPCAMAAWPVVAADGAVLACCNQAVVDRRPAPEHLLLGHVTTDGWPDVIGRSLASPVLRLIRAAGPEYLAERCGAWPAATSAGNAEGNTAGYCATCRALPALGAELAGAADAAAGAAGRFLDLQAAQAQSDAGPAEFLRRHGSARHAHLCLSEGGPALVDAG